MNENVKTPAWYRQQAAETRHQASLVDGPYGVLLNRLAEQWETLAARVASMGLSDQPALEAEIIQLDAFRCPRNA